MVIGLFEHLEIPPLRLLDISPMQDFTSLCKPFIELTASVSNLLTQRHTFEWELVSGNLVNWLTRTDQLTVAFEYIGPREDKIFSLTVDRGTPVEQYFLVNVNSTPSENINSELRLESNWQYGSPENTPISYVIPDDSLSQTDIDFGYITISPPSDSEFLTGYKVYERTGTSITNVSFVPYSNFSKLGPVNADLKYRINPVYEYPYHISEYTSPEIYLKKNDPLLFIHDRTKSSVSSQFSLGEVSTVDYSIFEKVVIDEVTSIGATVDGGYTSYTHEFVLADSVSLEDFVISSGSFITGAYGSTRYDDTGGSIGGI